MNYLISYLLLNLSRFPILYYHDILLVFDIIFRYLSAFIVSNILIDMYVC